MANDEYEIDAAKFAETLLEQRRMRLKGGLYHLTQIQMAYNTNRIEGSRLSEEQTRYLYETRTITGDALVDDVVETSNHFRAFDAMLDHVGSPITADTWKTYHRLLKSGTSDSEKDWFAVGDWKLVPNAVGNIETTPPEEVESAVQKLIARTPENLSFEEICAYHHDFETIHPFQDGNGRVGRLVMFEQCLANNIMPFIVLDSDKAFYYRGLDQLSETPGFLLDTFRKSQDEYFERFKKFIPSTGDATPADAAYVRSVSNAELGSETPHQSYGTRP